MKLTTISTSKNNTRILHQIDWWIRVRFGLTWIFLKVSVKHAGWNLLFSMMLKKKSSKTTINTLPQLRWVQFRAPGNTFSQEHPFSRLQLLGELFQWAQAPSKLPWRCNLPSDPGGQTAHQVSQKNTTLAGWLCKVFRLRFEAKCPEQKQSQKKNEFK